MKTALCLYGKIGGTTGKNGAGEPIDFRDCFTHIKKHIIDINNCDIFIHCWSTEYTKALLKLYKPKKSIFEPQIQFNTALKSAKDKNHEFICKSRWYSNKQTLLLKKQYEEENNFKYDFVMVSRFDLMFFVDFDFSKLDPSFLHASNWNDPARGITKANKVNRTLKNRRLLDMWFLGSSDFMGSFALLYDHIYEYAITDPHRASWDYIESFAGDPFKVIKFLFYRWFDYEIYRIKHGSKK